MANNRLRVFIDTSFFKALVDPNDDFHTKALEINQVLIKDQFTLTTTNYILDEAFTLIRKRCGLPKALELREKIINHSISIQVIRITTAYDAKAWEWFHNNWSDLSFTDCTSFAVMKRLGLTHVATFDKHFSQAGFTIVSPKS